MTAKTTSRLVRLGAARTLTRANSRGEFDELNPVLKYTIPPTESADGPLRRPARPGWASSRTPRSEAFFVTRRWVDEDPD